MIENENNYPYRDEEESTITAAIMTVLEDNGVTRIVLTYSGGGDSGDFERIYYERPGDEILKFPFDDIIQKAGEKIINDNTSDWVNNNGGYGALYINVPDGTWNIEGYIRVSNDENDFSDGELTTEFGE